MKTNEEMSRSERSDKAAALALNAAHNLTGALRQKSTREAIKMLKQSGRQLARAVALLEANEKLRRDPQKPGGLE